MHKDVLQSLCGKGHGSLKPNEEWVLEPWRVDKQVGIALY